MHRKPRTALVRSAVAFVAALLATLGLVAFALAPAPARR